MSRPARTALGAARILLGVGILGYILFVRGDWQVVGQIVSEVWILPAVTALAMMGASFETGRLRLLLRSQGFDLPFTTVLRLVLLGVFFGSFTPGGTGGDLAKLYYVVSDHRGGSVEVATVLVIDRAVGLFSMLLLVLFLAIPNRELLVRVPVTRFLLATAAAGLVGLLMVAGMSRSYRLRQHRWHEYLVSRAPLSSYLRRADSALFALRHQGSTLAGAVLLSCMGQAGLVATFMLLGSVLTPNVPVWTTAFLSLLGMTANALPLTPGGLGVGEAAFEALFTFAGYSGGARLLLTWRSGLLPLIVIGGLLYILRKHDQPGEDDQIAVGKGESSD